MFISTMETRTDIGFLPHRQEFNFDLNSSIEHVMITRIS